jgi:hypothetical protein
MPEKIGFILKGLSRNRMRDTNGNLKDVMIWTMFWNDYFKINLPAFSLKAFDTIRQSI